DIDYGARPLRRVIQNMVEDQLAEALLTDRFQSGMTVRVDKSEDAGLTIEPVEEKIPVEEGTLEARPRHGAARKPVRVRHVRRVEPSVGRPMSLVRRVEHAC